jgi:DNA primase
VSDIDRIRRDCPLPQVAQQFGVDLEADGHEFISCCPFHSEDTPSFTIFAGKDNIWRYHCFGCGAKGDVIDFAKQIKGVSTAEAIKILGGSAIAGSNITAVQRTRADPYQNITPLEPTSELAPNRKVVLYNPKREQNGNITPSAVYPYRRQDGSLIGYVLRHELRDGGKETPMVQWARLPSGVETWCRLPFIKPRPLYGLWRLGEGQVFVVEGEKCAEAMWKLRGKPVVAWAGGTYGVGHTDWSPLKGRDVIIWPDLDVPGYSTAKRVGEQLSGVASRVRYIDFGKEMRRARDDF